MGFYLSYLKGVLMMIYYYKHINTPIGQMTAVVNNHALIQLSFTDSNHYQTVISQLSKQADLKQVSFHPIIDKLAFELEGYFHGDVKSFKTPVHFTIGTPFQHQVWHALYQLPFGTGTTYSQIAQHIQKPKSVRAVSTAIGQNPLSIIVPCHRVLRKDGQLGGFNSGLYRKKALLKMEGVQHA